MNCACSWTGWMRAYTALSSLIRDPTTHEPDRLSAPVSHSAGVYPLPPGSTDPAPAAALVWAPDAARALALVSGPQGSDPGHAPAAGPGESRPGVHQVRPDPIDPPRPAAGRHRHRTGLSSGQRAALPLRPGTPAHRGTAGFADRGRVCPILRHTAGISLSRPGAQRPAA